MRAAKTTVVLVLLACLSWLAPGGVARAGSREGERGFDTLTVDWENDLLLGTDGAYTNGVRFTWSTPYLPPAADSPGSGWGRQWLESLPGANPGDGQAWSLGLGQAIYTPADIYRPVPDPDDRPYAGYTYLATAFHQRGPEVQTTWEIQLGLVGPQSFAEETQDFFHDWAGIGRARGWEHQLANEPTLELIAERQWLLWHGEAAPGFGFDLVPHLGGQLGTVAIQANLGGELRWGWRLPNRFGVCTIRGGCENNSAFSDEKSPAGMTLRSWYLFAGGEARWVLHNIFLDGNNFTASPSVERRPLVAELLAGISVDYWFTRLTCAAVYRSKEFEGQDYRESFGSFSLSLVY